MARKQSVTSGVYHEVDWEVELEADFARLCGPVKVRRLEERPETTSSEQPSREGGERPSAQGED